MANTTFSGAVRSESGFKQVTKNGSTGVFTTNFDVNSSGNITDVGSITSDGAISTTGIISTTVGMANATGILNPSFTAKIAIANGYSGGLAKNSWYISPADGNNSTMTLPAAAASSKGDAIAIEYRTPMVAGQLHKYGTTTEMFMVGSSAYSTKGDTGGVVSGIMKVDVSDATDDFLNLTGVANAGPGIGTMVTFTFNGTNWMADCRATTMGTGGGDANVAFGTS